MKPRRKDGDTSKLIRVAVSCSSSRCGWYGWRAAESISEAAHRNCPDCGVRVYASPSNIHPKEKQDG